MPYLEPTTDTRNTIYELNLTHSATGMPLTATLRTWTGEGGLDITSADEAFQALLDLVGGTSGWEVTGARKSYPSVQLATASE
ncbi:hypothetical protein [Microbispora sp. NPDC049125]|uniref:hypothetical protein n=1 Tax=Microbispora sp. NPDC049125 TaxID=3154929 RepID=UPI00346504FE